MAAIESLIRAGRHHDAAAMMESLAGAGNADALFALGLWRLGGHIVGLDLQAARDLFRRAGEGGRLDGARIYVNLLAAGVGGAADWPDALARLRGMADGGDVRSRAALALLDAMALAADGAPVAIPEGEPICQSPLALRFATLFTPEECTYLIEAATPLMSPSVVVDERSGRMIPHPIRTSDTALFPWLLADPAITALNRRLAVASGTALDQGEPLQVLRYTPGQQYRNHLDAISGASNQRVMTMIVYLTDDYDGGETRFVQAGIDHRGRRGDALLFHNALPDGRVDPRSEHAGLPVTRGAKLIASRWIRAKPFTADA